MEGRVHKDIINIVKRLIFCEAINKCNKEYCKLFGYCHGIEYGDRTFELIYKNGWYYICNRDIRGYYRKEIVYFITDTVTQNKVPKNY